MTSSRVWVPVLVLVLAAGTAGAQTQPKDLPWAVGELAGDADWGPRLPQLLVREWAAVTEHKLTDSEQGLLRQKFLDDTLTTLEKQRSALKLTLDRKRLKGAVTSTELTTAASTLKDLDAKVAQAAEGKTTGAEAPSSLAFRAVWPTGKTGQPWPASAGSDLASAASAFYTVTGSVHAVGPALTARIELYSAWEKRLLALWEGQFLPDEAATRMAEAADTFREALLGRPWARLAAEGTVPGSRIQVDGQWHPVPWSNDVLSPGPLEVVLGEPGHPDEKRSVTMEPGRTQTLTFGPADRPHDPLVLETVPPGALLYLDSRYLGPSPQTIDRPRSPARVRAEVPGGEGQAWEIGPKTPSPSVKVLVAQVPKPDVAVSKDRFYWSLALFSASLTTSAFTSAWKTEQVNLANAYAEYGTQDQLNTALTRYYGVTALYSASVVLTSGLFVWMMFELGDYLGSAQASLP
jgi:hypothetical protein